VSFGTYSGDTGLENGIHCYPNPVQDRLLITLDSPVSVVAVSNIAGQVIWQSGSVDTRMMTIDTGSWQQGIYFIRIVREGMEPFVGKVVKE
jgi:hypothetical protein